VCVSVSYSKCGYLYSQAALLDDMLAEAEEEDSRARNGGGSPHARKTVSHVKPSALASKYGVDAGSDGKFHFCVFEYSSLKTVSVSHQLRSTMSKSFKKTNINNTNILTRL
jgi:hypothetical protein